MAQRPLTIAAEIAAIIGTIVAIIALVMSLNGDSSPNTEEHTSENSTQRETAESVTPMKEVHRPPVVKETTPVETTQLPNDNVSFVIDMVYVVGGTFIMGINEHYTEKPMHTVNVSSFTISKYEVTQKQWREIMGRSPEELYFKGCDKCPVESVSWNDVQQFIKKLNQKTGKNYRLPSEAEWEYAARGGAKSKGYIFSGSNNLKEVAWSLGKSEAKWDAKNTHPVGSKQANELGLYDMSGNVAEWCEDNWHDNYKNAPSNSQAWEGGSKFIRVIRGGTWSSYGANNSRSDSRNRSVDTNRDQTSGFRLAHN